MKIKFLPSGIEVEGTPEKTLLQIATENKIEIRSICKGVPSCAECRVKIVEGDSYITAPSKAELGLIGTSYYLSGRRLSCQVRCFGPVTVDLTEQALSDNLKNKKIRGFKSSKPMDSQAVQDTMMLTNKVEEQDTSERNQNTRRPSAQQNNHQNRNLKQGQNQNPNQGQNSNQNQNQKSNNQNHRRNNSSRQGPKN